MLLTFGWEREESILNSLAMSCGCFENSARREAVFIATTFWGWCASLSSKQALDIYETGLSSTVSKVSYSINISSYEWAITTSKHTMSKKASRARRSSILFQIRPFRNPRIMRSQMCKLPVENSTSGVSRRWDPCRARITNCDADYTTVISVLSVQGRCILSVFIWAILCKQATRL